MFPHQHWKRDLADQLFSHSQVVETACGLVEMAAYGEGSAVLVLHGTSGGYDQGIGLAHLLREDELHFIAVSRPGYLRTPLSTGISPIEQAQACAALLDVLGIDQVSVVALSGGGPVGLEYALSYPHRCLGLVLISPLVRQRVPIRRSLFEQIQIRILETDFSDWLLNRELENNPQRVITNIVHNQKISDKLLSDPESMRLFIELIKTSLPASLRREGTRNDRAQFAGLREIPINLISAPVMIITGVDELLYEDAEFAASLIPNVEVVRSEGGTYLPFLMNKEILLPKVSDFLKNR